MKAAKLFLAVIFILTLSFGVRAQDKYEYATVIYFAEHATSYKIMISYGDKFEQLDGTIKEGRAYENISPANAILNKMSLEGWEAWSNSSVTIGGYYTYSFFLRKKKN